MEGNSQIEGSAEGFSRRHRKTETEDVEEKGRTRGRRELNVNITTVCRRKKYTNGKTNLSINTQDVAELKQEKDKVSRSDKQAQ